MKKLIPADTVDAEGTVWETTGENIRNGAKTFSESEFKAIVDALFPIGSIYCGENTFITSVGTWQLITLRAGMIIRLGSTSETGKAVRRGAISESTEEQAEYPSIRMWRRSN